MGEVKVCAGSRVVSRAESVPRVRPGLQGKNESPPGDLNPNP